jgi:hypothetical protein
MTDQDHRIRERAYHLWELAGRPDHRAGEFWARAEQEVRAESAALPLPTSKAEGKAPSKKKGAPLKEDAPQTKLTTTKKKVAEPDAKPKRKPKK